MSLLLLFSILQQTIPYRASLKHYCIHLFFARQRDCMDILVTTGHEIRTIRRNKTLLRQSTLICPPYHAIPVTGSERAGKNHVPRSGCTMPILKRLSRISSIFQGSQQQQAAPAHCFALTMVRLFSPCTRLRDLLESQGHRRTPDGLQELNLDVSTEDFLSAERAFTYADLYATLGNEYSVAWLTPHAAVVRAGGRGENYWGQLDVSCRFCFTVDGKEFDALSRSPEHLLGICDVVFRLLAASVVHSVQIVQPWSSRDRALIIAPTLAYLMEQCQSLKVLTLRQLDMDESHCRVLGVYSRPDFEIELIRCRLTSAGASALTEVLGRNQGPTKLDSCDIDYFVLADGLRGNSRLKSLRNPIFRNRDDAANQELLAIAGALKENKGLVEFNLLSRCSDETWDSFCDSLKTHPTLEILNLISHAPAPATAPAPAVITSRIQVLLGMLKMNMSIHTIHLNSRYSQHEIFRESVIPYLETNRFRPCVRAIQIARPIPYRAMVLGRALQSARTDPNSFWMLLSGNPEVAFPSSTMAISVAANLPTPATTFAFAPSFAADVNAATP
jgi:hypothetical protein